MIWTPSGTAVGQKGSYRVVPHNPLGTAGEGASGYDCLLIPTGFADDQEQLLLTDPSAVNARCRADAYDTL